MSKVNAVLIYNASCPFCVTLATWLQEQVGEETLEIAPNDKFLGWQVLFMMPEEDYKKDVHLITYNGYFYQSKSKSDAIIEAMRLGKKFEPIVFFYDKSFVFRKVFALGYILLKKSKSLVNRYFYE